MSAPLCYAASDLVGRPLCIDLFCGLGGWTEGFVAEGFDVIGFDIERHIYGEHRYPAQLVLQDVCTLHGSQFKDAACIVASSPCQEFSYRAMPWKRAKALGPPECGMHLFAQAARIQREACEAAGRYIPMIQENVRGAQPWVGKAQWHYGSYYLWGDVPALMPITNQRGVMKDGVTQRSNGETNFHHSAERAANGVKAGDRCNRATGKWTDGWNVQNARDLKADEIKNAGGSWFNVAHNTTSGHGKKPVHRQISQAWRDKHYDETAKQHTSDDGVKQSGISGERANGKGDRWFQDGAAQHGSESSARKAVSARIAKIPFPLARWIAHCFRPAAECVA